MGYKKAITSVGLQMLSNSVNSGNVVFDSIVCSSSSISKDVSNITINDFSNPYTLPINQINKDSSGFTAVSNIESQAAQNSSAIVAGIVGHTNSDSTKQLIAVAVSDSNVPIFSIESSQVGSYSISFSIIYSKDANIVINTSNSTVANIDDVRNAVDSVIATYNQTSNIVANDNLDSKTKAGTYLINNVDLSTLAANLGLPNIKITGALIVKSNNNLVSQTIEDSNGNIWSRNTGKAWGRLKSAELNNATTNDLSVLKNQNMFYNIMDFGAVRDDESFDNGAIINNILAQIPSNGGTILIPNGKFFIQTPIQINRNYIHIMGINNGLRSNIDAEIGDGLTHPGGGSRLIVSKTNSVGIQIGQRGATPRLSGIEISNLNILGANAWDGHVSQIGINSLQDSDGLKINNNTIINIDHGVIVHGGDTTSLKDNWISEVVNGAQFLDGSQQLQVIGNFMGAQPKGITLKIDGAYAATVANNNIYPDGFECIEMNNAQYCNITGNNIQSYYNSAILLFGSNNLFTNNMIVGKKMNGKWTNNPIGRDGKYGFIHVEGNTNLMTSNYIYTEQPSDDTVVLIMSGNDNTLKTNSIISTSSAKLVVNGSCNNTKSIYNSISSSEFQNGRNATNINVEA